jgi:hypothetical protein
MENALLLVNLIIGTLHAGLWIVALVLAIRTGHRRKDD